MTVGYNVWVMSLVAGLVVWDDTQWYVETRLLPIDCNVTPGAHGDATFRLLRETRTDNPTTGAVSETFFPTRGQYV
jgi:hypothetical protein